MRDARLKSCMCFKRSAAISAAKSDVNMKSRSTPEATRVWIEGAKFLTQRVADTIPYWVRLLPAFPLLSALERCAAGYWNTATKGVGKVAAAKADDVYI